MFDLSTATFFFQHLCLSLLRFQRRPSRTPRNGPVSQSSEDILNLKRLALLLKCHCNVFATDNIRRIRIETSLGRRTSENRKTGFHPNINSGSRVLECQHGLSSAVEFTVPIMFSNNERLPVITSLEIARFWHSSPFTPYCLLVIDYTAFSLLVGTHPSVPPS